MYIEIGIVYFILYVPSNNLFELNGSEPSTVIYRQIQNAYLDRTYVIRKLSVDGLEPSI